MSRGRNPFKKQSARKANPRAVEDIAKRVAEVHGLNREYSVGQEVILPLNQELINGVREYWQDEDGELANTMQNLLDKNPEAQVAGEIKSIDEELVYSPDEKDTLVVVSFPKLSDEPITMEASWFKLPTQYGF